jgi:hypothetical protein
MQVIPTVYEVLAHLLRAWVLEASMDGRHWSEIDRQTEENTVCMTTSRTARFIIANPCPARFLRLRQTEKNYEGRDDLSLRAFEVFGRVIT